MLLLTPCHQHHLPARLPESSTTTITNKEMKKGSAKRSVWDIARDDGENDRQERCSVSRGQSWTARDDSGSDRQEVYCFERSVLDIASDDSGSDRQEVYCFESKHAEGLTTIQVIKDRLLHCQRHKRLLAEPCPGEATRSGAGMSVLLVLRQAPSVTVTWRLNQS
ncbi:hypothetical protein PoB_005187600 [Plakobranchus ocellatus]|uniref:Uncharacterized protein n=1 Tax=Plakobranchus ocellatus TaxID=259542 RepID=A0AAV4BXV0_9GAST|nr:hypothetical protein PoB_005187600 [Plakobranchus ocellatus]